MSRHAAPQITIGFAVHTAHTVHLSRRVNDYIGKDIMFPEASAANRTPLFTTLSEEEIPDLIFEEGTRIHEHGFITDSTESTEYAFVRFVASRRRAV